MLESRGEERARFASAVIVERETDGAFAPVDGVELSLRASCETPAPECVTLVGGAELRPPPWRGQLGQAQCECERCADAPEGRYRFVIRSCSGAHRVEGQPFELRRP